MKKTCELLILFAVGALVYLCIELLWRGHTHWAMGIVGGLAFVIIGGLNEQYEWDMSFLKQCVIGALVITCIEFVAGVILNIELGLGIWDYSNLPFNIMGQICLPFSLLWVILSGVAIVLDDILRYLLFGEEKPHYRF